MKRLLTVLLFSLLIPALALAATSSELMELRTETSAGYRIDYLNEEGDLTAASDKGYASRVCTVDGSLTTETYLGEDGLPVALSSGQYGVIKHCDEDGNTVEITYLNENGEAANLTSGYAIARRDYRDGRVVREMYYTPDGEPAVLSQDYSGYERDFNEAGKVSRITYLDGEGNVTVTASGYDTVLREYDGEGNLRREWFYVNGSPARLLHGQYGTEHVYENGKQTESFRLDRNGNRLFVLSDFLSENVWVCLIACAILVVLSVLLPKVSRIALLALYVLFVLYMTLVRKSDDGINLELFWSYRQFFSKPELALEILDNILLFIPLGALLYSLYPSHRAVYIAVALSVLIETTQLLGHLGLCELDDVVSNGLGAALGAVSAAFPTCRKAKKEKMLITGK